VRGIEARAALGTALALARGSSAWPAGERTSVVHDIIAYRPLGDPPLVHPRRSFNSWAAVAAPE
jgi:hypothetical protein